MRDELLDDATPALAPVTDIALKRGFAHLGRFAIDYNRAFGGSPSATLRMRRVRG
nr:helix-turn-helix domain-containing protein [Burkholderia latens]